MSTSSPRPEFSSKSLPSLKLMSPEGVGWSEDRTVLLKRGVQVRTWPLHQHQQHSSPIPLPLYPRSTLQGSAALELRQTRTGLSRDQDWAIQEEIGRCTVLCFLRGQIPGTPCCRENKTKTCTAGTLRLGKGREWPGSNQGLPYVGQVSLLGEPVSWGWYWGPRQNHPKTSPP